MGITTTTEPVRASTLRVRRHRQRRRNGMLLFTVEVPERVIEQAITRGLLKQEDRTNPWPVIQGWYAALLSDAVLNWLTKSGIITRDQRGDARAILRSIDEWLVPRIVPPVGQRIAAGVPEHVRVRPEAELGGDAGALDHAGEARRRKWRAPLRCEDE